jgi:hypothetical protein
LRVLSSDSEGYGVNWFEAARERFGGSGEYPLIDDDEIVEAKAVNDYWPWVYGSGRRNADELRQVALRQTTSILPSVLYT